MRQSPVTQIERNGAHDCQKNPGTACASYVKRKTPPDHLLAVVAFSPPLPLTAILSREQRRMLRQSLLRMGSESPVLVVEVLASRCQIHRDPAMSSVSPISSRFHPLHPPHTTATVQSIHACMFAKIYTLIATILVLPVVLSLLARHLGQFSMQ
jgi:hypothetical protein